MFATISGILRPAAGGQIGHLESVFWDFKPCTVTRCVVPIGTRRFGNSEILAARCQISRFPGTFGCGLGPRQEKCGLRQQRALEFEQAALLQRRDRADKKPRPRWRPAAQALAAKHRAARTPAPLTNPGPAVSSPAVRAFRRGRWSRRVCPPDRGGTSPGCCGCCTSGRTRCPSNCRRNAAARAFSCPA